MVGPGCQNSLVQNAKTGCKLSATVGMLDWLARLLSAREEPKDADRAEQIMEFLADLDVGQIERQRTKDILARINLYVSTKGYQDNKMCLTRIYTRI